MGCHCCTYSEWGVFHHYGLPWFYSCLLQSFQIRFWIWLAFLHIICTYYEVAVYKSLEVAVSQVGLNGSERDFW